MDEVKRKAGCCTLAANLGGAMADVAERHRQPDDPAPCSTCGLKRATLANMNNRTMMDAMNVLLGIDGDAFGCHHGLKDGQPTKPCINWVAARRAPFSEIKEALTGLLADKSEVDHVGDYIEAWLNEHDPERLMDNYQMGRLWEKTRPHVIEGQHDRAD